ncbi:hypothetical protein FSP39_015152 [Pinctada imbricata]|uniref:Ionotropic glutamate receptor C-terminal domain-containing protein n=1 Tax=Pinctada imbricata TaxID=66713 RepID=A0AA89C6L7_PINIB|nr:hypothetical protein FSP39_015152 [Pinctada imbricata]
MPRPRQPKNHINPKTMYVQQGSLHEQDLIIKFSPFLFHKAIVGRKGSTDIDDYLAVVEELKQPINSKYCEVRLLEIPYDISDGRTVYDSLTTARRTFAHDNVSVVIGPYIDVFTSMAYVIQKQIHLLTVQMTVPDISDRLLPILPSPDSLSLAVAKIVQKLGWKKVSFLAQDDFSPVAPLTETGATVIPIRLPTHISSKNDNGLRQTLTNMRSSLVENIILHTMKKDVVNYTLSAVRKSIYQPVLFFGKRADGLMPDKSRLDIGKTVDTISFLYHLLHHSRNCSQDPLIDSVINPFLFADFIQTQRTPYIGSLGKYVWVKQNDSDEKIRTEYSMKVVRHSRSKSVEKDERIKQIGNCSFRGEEPQIVSTVGQWVEQTEVELSKVLADNLLTVITKVEAPFVMKRGRHFEGFCVDVLRELEKKMGFKNASVAIGALAVTSQREERISFSFTIISTSSSMLSKKPPSSPTVFQFMWPFTWDLWVMIAAFFLVVGVALWLMSRYDITQHGSEQQFDLKESMWYSLNVLLQGGTDYSPQTTSMRTIVAFFWFCTLIIISAYTANLAAFLTLKQIDTRIKTVDMLSRQAEVKYGIINNSDTMDFFQNSTNDPFARMWAVIKLNEKDRLLPNRKAANKKVQAGVGDGKQKDFVLIDEEVINEYYALQECDMESLRQNFGEKKYSMGFPKGAPYKDDINRALLEMKEAGILDELKKKWWTPSEKCREKGDVSENTLPSGVLDIENMLGVFIVLAACVVIAVLVEAVKRLYVYRKSRNDEQVSIHHRVFYDLLIYIKSFSLNVIVSNKHQRSTFCY